MTSPQGSHAKLALEQWKSLSSVFMYTVIFQRSMTSVGPIFTSERQYPASTLYCMHYSAYYTATYQRNWTKWIRNIILDMVFPTPAVSWVYLCNINHIKLNISKRLCLARWKWLLFLYWFFCLSFSLHELVANCYVTGNKEHFTVEIWNWCTACGCGFLPLNHESLLTSF